MDDILRLRIGDLKDEAEETARFIGVSVSALTRMALRDKIEQERPRMEAAAARAGSDVQPSKAEVAS